MHEINCNVIRDLLPGYVDGLASEDSRALVQEHVETCESCRAALEAMRAPEPVSAPEEKEIDFLKKNRRKNRRVLVWSLIGALALACLVLAMRALVVGSDAGPDWLYSEVSVEGENLVLRCSPTDSAGAVAGLKISEDDGVVTVSTRRVLVSPLHRGGASANYTASGPIHRVVVNGRVVWDMGVDISAFTAQLFALRTPYVGDASADMAILNALLRGEYTIALQTETEPYGLTVRLPERTSEEIAALQPQLRDAGCALFVLIENLGEVEFTFGDSNTASVRVTEADAEQMLHGIVVPVNTAGEPLPGPAIKGCQDNPAALERLLRGLHLNGPVYLDTAAASAERTVRIVNGTDIPIKSMTLSAYSDGEIVWSETGMYADESQILYGNTMDFSVSADYAALGYDLRLTCETMDGYGIIAADSVDPTAAQLTLRRIVTDDGAIFTLEP